MVYSESELKILNEATKLIALDTQLVVGESLILLKDFFGLLLKKSAKPT